MIQAFFDEFKAACPAGTEVLLGSEHLDGNSSPPRIVVFPSHGTYGQGEAEPARNPLTSMTETPLGRRVLNMGIVVWGQDLASTDAACMDVYALLGHKFRFDQIQEAWDTDEPLVQLGVAVMLTVPLMGSVFKVPTYTAIEKFSCSSCQS